MVSDVSLCPQISKFQIQLLRWIEDDAWLATRPSLWPRRLWSYLQRTEPRTFYIHNPCTPLYPFFPHSSSPPPFPPPPNSGLPSSTFSLLITSPDEEQSNCSKIRDYWIFPCCYNRGIHVIIIHVPANSFCNVYETFQAIRYRSLFNEVFITWKIPHSSKKNIHARLSFSVIFDLYSIPTPVEYGSPNRS